MPLHSVRRLLGFGAALVVAAAADCKKEEPFVPAATTVTVTPSARAFHAVTHQQQFAAAVKDQHGNPFTGVAVSWSSNNMGVAQVSGAGLVTAFGVGSATITATAGTVTGTASVTVTQIAASLFKFDGDAQAAPVGTQLPVAVTARVLDSASSPMQGVTINFAAGNGGSVGAASAVTGPSGGASTTWTLGLGVGAQQLTVSSTGLTSVMFSATALAARADTIIKQTADASNVPAGTPVAPAPAVLVRDSLGNPVAGVTVTFAITAGGGQLSGATPNTNASGIATLGSWIVGASGAQTVTATATGTGIGGNPITFSATVLPAGAPASIVVSAGNNQTGLQGYPVNVRPAAIVRDASSNPVQGATVNFVVQTGGGSLTNASVTTDLVGLARVGSWTILNGANSLTASVGGVATPATFTATGVPSSYHVDVRFLTSMTANQQAAFDSAAAQWARVIFGDVTDVPGVSTPAGGPPGTSCQRPEVPAVNETVDDVIIFAIVQTIDGEGQILGSAGPCLIRTGGDARSIMGIMRFDIEDLPNLEAQNLLRPVILHEMGHVLGLGTLWPAKGLITGAGGSDPFFTGAQARAAFDEIGGTGYTGGGKVPVENTGGGGTRDAHWRESVFTNELMTGFINLGSNPMSIVTAAQFADLGYQVNLGAADAFSVSFPAALRAAQQQTIHLVGDVERKAILVVDFNGRVVGTIQPK